jgi:3-oxoacyl-[acyl-carrier protein] reductase
VLENKVAVVYGAGSIGSAVAKAFAAAGAQVHLASRTKATLDALAGAISAGGGKVHTETVDALDPTSVREHADRVAAEAGRIDICFNLIGHGDVHGTPLIEPSLPHPTKPA